MVSISKMVQSSHWLLQLILLCILGNNLQPSDREYEYSSIRIHQEDLGEIALFVVVVVIGEIGKRLDKGYRCPINCAVDHKHIYWENNEVKKSNIQAVNGLYRTVRDTSSK